MSHDVKCDRRVSNAEQHRLLYTLHMKRLFNGCPGLYWDGHQHFRTVFLLGKRHPTHQKRWVLFLDSSVCLHAGAQEMASSLKVKLPENDNPAGRLRRPFQHESCTARERKSRRPPATAVPVLKLYYQRTKIQPAAGDGRSSIKAVLPENENPGGRTRERKSSMPPATAVPVLKLYYQTTTSSRPPATAVPVLKLYYQRTKIQPAAGDGRSRTKVVLPNNDNPAARRRRPFQY